ncbi:ANK [Mytilus coruscus]|uniref:ANK n=1 Tax=Mytilus coruscus TaxID=42192 RepID=A0A6J8A1P4_MYTCO|nr:ANK [Mytilus coruscus]
MNQYISSITPLSFACLENRTKIINKLIDLGANVNKSGLSGMTPLPAACYYEYIDLAVLELLLKHKACVDKRMFDGSTPLLVASLRQNREAVNILLNSSADFNIGFYDSPTIKDGMKKMFRSITDEEEAKFWDLVMDYLPCSCVGQVKQIANLLIYTISRATPLHLTCLGMDMGFSKDLLDRNPDINIRKEDGSTPLFVACELGYVAVATLLLEHDADQYISKNDGTSPLDIARQNKFAEIVKLLEGTKRKSTRIANRRKRKKCS